MFNLRLIPNTRKSKPANVFNLCDVVTVLRSEYGTEYTDNRIGEIHLIALSPYWHEAQMGIQRAYVVGNGWTDWVLATDIKHFVQVAI